MPFDGVIFNNRYDPSRLPIEIQILDRARELIATDERWLKGHFSALNCQTGVTSYCLYGALLAAEREIAYELPWSGTILQVSTLELHPRTTAFGRVHATLNTMARPFYCVWSCRQSYAMFFNDQSKSLRRVHKLIARARCKLMQQAISHPTTLAWEVVVQ